jgi:23S rRNA (uracil1939-C5)-methyltransferase
MTCVEISGIAAGGDGVGRLEDGMTVFVPRTAPGDVVEVELTAIKRHWAKGIVRSIVQPSKVRVEPTCEHYDGDDCGGCQLQHLDAAAQLEAKSRIVGDALRRIGGLDVENPDVIPSPSAWRYRTKISFSTPRRQRNSDAVGLHRYHDPEQVFAPEDCPITCESVTSLWRAVAQHRRLLPKRLDALTLREDREGQCHILCTSADRWDATPLAAALAPERQPSVWWKPSVGTAVPILVAGPDMGFPALSFDQSNPALAQRIREDAVARLDVAHGAIVWDLYGGVGDTARLLAAGGATVWSVDADRRAKEWAREPRDRRIEHLASSVEEALPSLPTPDAVVANPPRRGMGPTVVGRLQTLAAPIAYISCDPATLARDLRQLTEHRLSGLQAYDLFPQTSHVEVLAVLERVP